MKKQLLLWSFTFIVTLSILAQEGTFVYAKQMGWYTVAYQDSKCVILSNNYGFTFVELYSGFPKEDMPVLGPINIYGLHEFFDENGNETFRGYIDDWGMSEQRAIEKINDKCNPR